MDEVLQAALEHDPAWRGCRVLVVGALGLFFGQRVGEGVVEFLRGQRDGPLAVGRVLQDGEGGAQLGERQRPDSLHARAVDRHACRPETVADQELRERAPDRMAHDDGAGVQLADVIGQVIHDLADADPGHEVGVSPERLEVGSALADAGVTGREDGMAPHLIALDPVLPGQRGHPQPVDQDDGGGWRCHAPMLFSRRPSCISHLTVPACRVAWCLTDGVVSHGPVLENSKSEHSERSVASVTRSLRAAGCGT